MNVRKLLFSITVTLAVVALTASAAGANQIRGSQWNDDGVVLYEGCCYSNAVGLWQTIISTTGCGMYVDGYFGPATAEGTGGVQQDIAGVTVDYVVGSATWNGVQYSTSVFGPRLTGPWGDNYYSYYGGDGAFQAKLWWDGSWNGEWDWEMPGQANVWYNSETSQIHISAHQRC